MRLAKGLRAASRFLVCEGERGRRRGKTDEREKEQKIKKKRGRRDTIQEDE